MHYLLKSKHVNECICRQSLDGSKMNISQPLYDLLIDGAFKTLTSFCLKMRECSSRTPCI